MQHNKNLDKLILRNIMNQQPIQSHTEGNPLAEQLNLNIDYVSEKKIQLSYDVSTAFTQGRGVIQGGIVSAMLDFAAAYLGLINVEDDKAVVTTNLSVNYLRPAFPGKYFVEANLDKTGSKMVYASAKIYQENQKTIANAIFTMAVV